MKLIIQIASGILLAAILISVFLWPAITEQNELRRYEALRADCLYPSVPTMAGYLSRDPTSCEKWSSLSNQLRKKGYDLH